MGPKKKSNKLSTSSAGHRHQGAKSTGNAAKAATKVDISSGNEARLRRLLANVSSSEEVLNDTNSVAAYASDKKAAKTLKETYDALQREGFSIGQVEAVLKSLPQVRIIQPKIYLLWFKDLVPARAV